MSVSELDQSDVTQNLLQKMNEGDTDARNEVIRLFQNQMTRIARKMKGGYGSVIRWEQTEDVLQQAAIRLFRALDSVQVKDTHHLLSLMALQIRRELTDMSRHYSRANGLNARIVTNGNRQHDDDFGAQMLFDPAEMTGNPETLQQWGDFHLMIDQLPEQEKAVVDLVWYHEMKHEDVAKVLEISDRQVRRLWRNAKILLFEKLDGRFPGE